MTDINVVTKRRFAVPSEKHMADSELLSIWGERETGMCWENIVSSQCVVVLGEGKCGKTYEFKRQHQLLRADNQYSFFVPLELLQDNDLFDVITAEEEHDFEHWQNGSIDKAIFFLDAVDELKLRQGTLRKALRKIRQTIGGALSRSRFYISCRPNDWNEELDYRALGTLVAAESHQESELEIVDGEKILIDIFSNNGTSQNLQPNDEQLLNDPIQVLTLLPFSRHETIEFAKSYAPNQAEAFEHYLKEKELWHLYHLPYEIISALDQLTVEGTLGNLQEQLQFGIKHKLREISGKRRNSLTDDKALEGSQRLALALFMMKRRSIHSNGLTGGENVVNIGDILTDWTEEERLELLGKPLFDPTGVNSFRFYHRSAQEYLAAKRLKKLREQGLNTRELFKLLFADIKDEKVLIPSMEPITAWLAIWYPDVYYEVKVRSPALMFLQGMPALLSFENREELIRNYVEKFSHSTTWCGIGIGREELMRVAQPELSPVVRELWQDAYTGYETRELFLKLIYLAQMQDCTDLARAALFDDQLPYVHRTYAAWSLLEFGDIKQKKIVGNAVIHAGWPERLIRSILPSLIPDAMNEKEFLELAKSLNEVPNDVHGLGYALFNGVESKLLTAEQRIYLRDSFAQEIWSNRKESCRIYQTHSTYDHFVDALILSCFMTLPSSAMQAQQWAWCLAIAFHFGERRTSIVARKQIEELKTLLSKDTSLREAYYWACLCIVEALEKNYNFINNTYLIDYDNLLLPFSENDVPWLMNAFASNQSKNKKDAAFHELIQILRGSGNLQLEQSMLKLASNNNVYLEVLEKVLNPSVEQPNKYEIENQRWKLEHEEREAKRIKGWQDWRAQVLNSETFLLHEEVYENTIFNLYKMLKKAESGISAWGVWDSSLIERVFSAEFLEALRPKMSALWRKANIALYSERVEEVKNSFSGETMMSLVAIKCCSESPNWAESLTHDEALKAVRISTIELNGFADFLSKVELSHPKAVEEIFIYELQAQIECFKVSGNAPIFHDVFYFGSKLIKDSTIIAIMSKLDAITDAMEKGPNSDLKYIFELAATHELTEVHCALISLIEQKLDIAQITVEDRNLWVALLALFDLEKACARIMQFTSDVSSDDKSKSAVALFATVLGNNHRGKQPAFDDIEPMRRLSVLRDLLIRSYQVVKPSEDNIHEGGMFTPNERDNAERVRSYLLASLSQTHVIGTISILYELSNLSEFHHLSNRLKQIAVELAARISEPLAMSAVVFNEFDKELNYLPYDDASLFKVLNNRLEDFVHHLLNDEQTIVDTLRKVVEETELRRFISYWLNQHSRNAYTTTQEAVVVSEKRTDIRLHPSGIDKYASIELKLDDERNNWSGSDLKVALVEQLVGRYLNHERCYVGCLLIAMRNTRRWENPETHQRMSLKETVSWLQGIANEIMDGHPELYISVKGIDYSKIANE